VLLLRGEWKESLRLHAYAPVLLLTLALLATGLFLRGRSKVVLCEAVRWTEERALLSTVLLLGVIVYWLLRMVLDGPGSPLIVN
jgi:hypothetical protein